MTMGRTAFCSKSATALILDISDAALVLQARTGPLCYLLINALDPSVLHVSFFSSLQGRTGTS